MTAPDEPVRAAVLHGPGDVRLERVPAQTPGEGEVLVRVETALTGGTVWKTVARGGHARFGPPPLRLGHEGVGRVAAVGPGSSGWSVGERVLVGDSAACGVCAACRREQGELCADLRWLTGLFGDEVLVPARHVAKNLHRVPDELPSDVAALADNLASVLHGEERTPARPGERALVVGSGPLSRLWCWALSRCGAEVTLVGRRAESLEGAQEFGAQRVLTIAPPPAPAPPAPPDVGHAFPLVIEAVGAAATWALALSAVAPGGRVNGFGGPPEGTLLPVDVARLHYDEVTLASSFHYAPRHLGRALALLAGPGPWRSLLAPDAVPLAELPAMLSGPRPTDWRKHVVRP